MFSNHSTEEEVVVVVWGGGGGTGGGLLGIPTPSLSHEERLRYPAFLGFPLLDFHVEMR